MELSLYEPRLTSFFDDWVGCNASRRKANKKFGQLLTYLPRRVALPMSSGIITKVKCGKYFTSILVRPCPGENNFHRRVEAAELFNKPESGAEIVFTIDEETVCHAHKHILCACSTYFEGLFRVGMMETEKKKPLIEAPKDVFLVLMRFIYGVEMNPIEPEMTPTLFHAADYYGLDGVKAWCCDTLDSGLTLQNAGSILQDSFERSQNDLQDICIEFILKNKSVWTKDPQYTDQVESRELLLQIIGAASN